MKTVIFLKITGSALLTVSLLSCGGGGDGSAENASPPPGQSANPRQGQFIDAPVQGLKYVSGNQSRITDTNGMFNHEDGTTVKFSVGDILLGEGQRKSVMSPIDLVSGAIDVNNPTVINIARFLQTLDDNAKLADGIQITDVESSLAAGKSVNFNQDTTAFENDGNVQTVVSTLTSATTTGAKNLITASAAQYNLQNGLTGGNQPPINPAPTPPPAESNPAPTPPPSVSQGYRLPDTGQTKCYDNNGIIDCPAPGQPFYGQDAQYRGAQPGYQDNKNGTVADLNTGLMWQQDGSKGGDFNAARAACIQLLTRSLDSRLF